MSQKYTESEIDFLRENYCRLSISDISLKLGKTPHAIRNKLWRLGLVDKSNNWTESQVKILIDAYKDVQYSSEINLPEIAKKIGKHKSNVCRKAKALGLTNISREMIPPEQRKIRVRKFATKEDLSANISAIQKALIKKNGHPKRMLGKTHSEKTKAILSIAAKNMNANRTDEQKTEYLIKAMKTKILNGTYAQERPNTSWKSGWREIGGIRKYYRSKWEANYAYYLQWLKENGSIKDWLHEPVTFWFLGVKRGCVSYLPDFWVQELDGSEAYHEVKGWMDDKSKTKIKRMAKYHPLVKLVVVDSKNYTALKKSVQGLVPGWEK